MTQESRARAEAVEREHRQLLTGFCSSRMCGREVAWPCPTLLLARDVLAGLEREKRQESEITYFKTSEPAYQQELKEHAHTRRTLDAKDHEFAQMKDRAESAERERDLLRSRLEGLREAAEGLVACLTEATPHINAVCEISQIHGLPYRGPSYGEPLALLRAALDAVGKERGE